MRSVFTVLTGAWHIVFKRARANGFILCAALVTMLLATTLLAAAPIYATSVAEAGLPQALRDAPVTSSNVQVSASVLPGKFTASDTQVRQTLQPILQLTDGTISRVGFSTPYSVPGTPTVDGSQRLATFAFFDQIQRHARLVSGAWPANGSVSAPYAVTIPQPTAQALGLKLGDRLALTDRLDTAHVVQVRINGIYRIDSAQDPFWFADPLSVTGIIQSGGFTTYGPLVVAPTVLLGPITSQSATVDWRLFPTFDRISIPNAARLRTLVATLGPRLNVGPLAGNVTVTTQLATLLDTINRSLLVTRAAVLLLTIQLTILSAYALVLTAGLLTEQRRAEYALLSARGISRAQMLAMATLEGLLLAIPAVVAGPWLAALSLRLLNVAGPLAGIGLSLHPIVNRNAYLLAIAGGIVCLLALVRPALFPPKGPRQRAPGSSLWQRAGLDVGLLVLAAIAYWQLKHYGAPLTQTARGGFGIDPLLVAAPAIGLVAGAIIALRLIPLLASLADSASGRRVALIVPLGVRQVARRPLRYARSGLLLILAIGIGLFAIAYGRTWVQSQRDQAAYQAGAGIRLTPARGAGAIPGYDLASAEQAILGVSTSMPVSRLLPTVPVGNGVGNLVLLDAAKAPGIVMFRPDLSQVPLPTLMERLDQSKPDLATVHLPRDAERLRVGYTVALDLLPQPVPPAYVIGPVKLPLSAPTVEGTLIVRDGSGVLRTLDLGVLQADDIPRQIVVPLADRLSGNVIARPDTPLDLVQIDLLVYGESGVSRIMHLKTLGLATSPDLTGNTWSPLPLVPRLDSGQPTGGFSTGAATDGSAESDPNLASFTLAKAPPGALAATIRTSKSDGAVPFNLTPAGSTLPGELPVLVNRDFLQSMGITVGGEFPIAGIASPLYAKVVGTVKSFPTFDPSQPLIVADLGTFSAMEFFQSGANTPVADANITVPDERWLAVNPADGAAAATLRAAPYNSPSVMSYQEQARDLSTDPIALGMIGALALGFVAAIIFAAVGFAVSAAVSVHERLPEFATLRALGLSPGQLAGWLIVEQGMLIVLCLIGGTVVGLSLAWLVLPLITVTQSGAHAVPSLIVYIPWPRLAVMETIVVATLLVMVGVLAAAMRRVGIGHVLRMGEE